MKRVSAEYPWDNWWIYRVWHEKEKRFMANLVNKEHTKVRTTTAYARYLMSTMLGRFLGETEHVDHINNDRSDDSISNLQILTFKENSDKYNKFYRATNPKWVELECSFCNRKFEYLQKNHKYRKAKGQLNFYCSTTCLHNKLRKVV